MMKSVTPSAERKKITIERTFDASIEEVWDLWTTKEGIESWWGPEGFATEVRKLDLRPGGELFYSFTAVAPDQIAFLRNAGMPLTQELHATYTEVVPLRRLAYTSRADFVPGVEPYDVDTAVDLSAGADGVRIVLTLDAMHDEQWSKLMVMGWESELGKLAKVLESRRS
jgi:uncharacterized protein YndB with AHSA1/START domain